LGEREPERERERLERRGDLDRDRDLLDLRRRGEAERDRDRLRRDGEGERERGFRLSLLRRSSDFVIIGCLFALGLSDSDSLEESLEVLSISSSIAFKWLRH